MREESKDMKDGGKKIKMIASGQQHSVALDENGIVHVWGYNAYCRLGLGNQADLLKPKPVPQFTPPQSCAIAVAAGPTNTAVIDKQGMYWIAGKWKNSGGGSSGSLYSTFRVMQDNIAQPSLQGIWTVLRLSKLLPVKIPHSSLPKSLLHPILVFLSLPNLRKPTRTYSDLPRHPAELGDAPELCMVCGRDNGEDDSPLECDKCDSPYHLGGLKPPLKSLPDGEWFCPRCAKEPGKALAGFTAPVPPKITSRPSAAPGTPQTGGSRKHRDDDMEVDGRENGVDGDDDGEDDEDMDEDDGGRK